MLLIQTHIYKRIFCVLQRYILIILPTTPLWIFILSELIL